MLSAISASPKSPPTASENAASQYRKGKRKLRPEETFTGAGMLKYQRSDVNWSMIHDRTTRMLMGKDKGKAASSSVQPLDTLITLPSLCSNCQRPAKAKCHFCEHVTCASCCDSCECCQNVFCRLCFTINYDEPQERCFCITCASDSAISNQAGPSGSR
ncbi:hypothetical protein DFS34DRAFT_468828 [Phlyctochytrium arcticum]|nr:hypothetical protein DFS34DRAFT_468828 [Phlyctochytrium arcticum]